VRITDAFYISDHEMTVGEYRKFIEATEHDEPKCSDQNWIEYTSRERDYYKSFRDYGKSLRDYDRRQLRNENTPISCVSWVDAQAYIKWFNSNYKGVHKGVEVRLCTEAEWEYAARAGTTTKWSCGEYASCLNQHAWYSPNAFYKRTPVKTKKPNASGLYDMHGNVWEWVQDTYDQYSFFSRFKTTNNPINDSSGSYGVLRGGSYRNKADGVRSANRKKFDLDKRDVENGIRLCRSKGMRNNKTEIRKGEFDFLFEE